MDLECTGNIQLILQIGPQICPLLVPGVTPLLWQWYLVLDVYEDAKNGFLQKGSTNKMFFSPGM